MALASDSLTPHFTYGELNAHVAPLQYQPNALRTAQYLETIRSILGVPLVRVSGWRSPARNEAVGGSSSSSHLTAEAADFTPSGISQFSAYRKLNAAKKSGTLPPFDQIIYYPFSHLHVGIGPRMRQQVLIRISENNYATLTPSLATTLPGAGSAILLGIALLALGIFVMVNN